MMHALFFSTLMVALVVFCGLFIKEAKAQVRQAEKERDEHKIKWLARNAAINQMITAHQRELDALRAKHLEECAEKQAETEMYMEAARRLKEENDALTVQLAAFKDVYTGGTPIKVEGGVA